MKTDPARAEVYLRKATALSVDPRMPKALSSTEFKAYVYNEPYYDELAENIQARLIELRYRGIPGRTPEPDVLKNRCQAVAAWPPAWRPTGAKFKLSMACESAYLQVFDKWPPKDTPAVVDGVVDPIEPATSG